MKGSIYRWKEELELSSNTLLPKVLGVMQVGGGWLENRKSANIWTHAPL
jgi:hypothetical protein